MCECVWWSEGTQLLTVAMGSLHVVLHVALLSEPDAAHLALEGLLSSVFDHVDLQSALLVEGFVTLAALKGTLACRQTKNQLITQEERNALTLISNLSHLYK